MICPVSSNTMTDVDIVCVTAADMAAAPVPQTKQQSVSNLLLTPILIPQFRKYHEIKSLGSHNFTRGLDGLEL